MTVKQYKEIKGLSNRELTKELQAVQPELTEPLVSQMVNGIVGPSKAVEDYMSECVYKQCDAARIESIEQWWATIPFEEEMRSNPRFSTLYTMIADASRENPALYPRMVHKTGKSRREVQSLISEMRQLGVPIVSYTGHEGFWMAQTEKDMKDLVGMYEKQAKQSLMIASRLKKVCGGQMTWAEERG